MSREELLQHAKPILFNTDMVRAILDGRKTGILDLTGNPIGQCLNLKEQGFA